MDTQAAMSALLDLHLSRFIERYKEPQPMRGMQRLANATQSVLRDMDDEAGKVADDLIAAQNDSKAVIDGFRTFVGEIKANTQQVRDVLAQLTNGGPALPNSDGSVGSVTAVPTAPAS